MVWCSCVSAEVGCSSLARDARGGCEARVRNVPWETLGIFLVLAFFFLAAGALVRGKDQEPSTEYSNRLHLRSLSLSNDVRKK